MDKHLILTAIRKRQSDIDALKAELQEMTTKFEELQESSTKELETAKKQIESTAAERDRYKISLRTIRSQREALEKEQRRLEITVEEMQRRYDVLLKDHKALQSRSSPMDSPLVARANLSHELESEYQRIKESSQESKDRLDNYEFASQKNEAHLKQLEEQLAAEREQKASLEQEVKSLQQQQHQQQGGAEQAMQPEKRTVGGVDFDLKLKGPHKGKFMCKPTVAEVDGVLYNEWVVLHEAASDVKIGSERRIMRGETYCNVAGGGNSGYWVQDLSSRSLCAEDDRSYIRWIMRREIEE